ncbi:uncharacterized protein N7515_007936 [Penicillium bovifimosum]|uniref:SnoaL-like domain-containing protein n=1 Tax=Penicillium bovifimosum TaxID=126998 RepID=A0A9W9GM43_9EURO|nr:uncharacterized protein N7515_007936 [Penicillium bovifimosum]KAJ5124111.1 hypothetical protein N7515_007936 [Penicillium bovifimosum]
MSEYKNHHTIQPPFHCPTFPHKETSKGIQINQNALPLLPPPPPVHALLEALTTPNTPQSTLLSTFTTSPSPLAHEHGLPQLAPFLGRPFTGQEGLKTYFDLLSTHLSIETMTFEPDADWVVDESCMAVSLRGKATFVWKETGQGWDETFVYRIRVAEECSGSEGQGQGTLKVCEYRVWADTGAAYLARIGGLKGLLGEGGEDVDLGFG